MGTIQSRLGRMTTPTRWSLVSACVLAVIGAAVGLALGLDAYPPTAWFAVLEVGVPAGVVGAVIGFAAGALATAFRGGSTSVR